MSEKIWSDEAWDDYLYWQLQDKKTLKRINLLIKDIERNGQPVEQIFVGKRLIGEVVADKERFKAILLKGEQAFYVRSQEEGLETILQQYHLHQG